MGNEDDFERELRDLLLTAFADGERVSGKWTMATVPDQLPNWRVSVERWDGESEDRSAVGD